MTLDEILQSHATVYAGYPESYQDIAAAAAERTATVIHDRPQADAYIQRLQASLVSLEQDYSHLVEQVRAVLTDVYHAYTTGTPSPPTKSTTTTAQTPTTARGASPSGSSAASTPMRTTTKPPRPPHRP
jgi:hypothetical protein